MKTEQELFDYVMKEMEEHRSKELIEDKSGGIMGLYHKGHVLAFKSIAERLVRCHGCNVKKTK